MEDCRVHLLGLLHGGHQRDAKELYLETLQVGIGDFDLLGDRLLEIRGLRIFLEERLVLFEGAGKVPLVLELIRQLELGLRRLVALRVVVGDVAVGRDRLLRIARFGQCIGRGQLLQRVTLGKELILDGLGLHQPLGLRISRGVGR